jgi:hypothetical protein
MARQRVVCSVADGVVRDAVRYAACVGDGAQSWTWCWRWRSSRCSSLARCWRWGRCCLRHCRRVRRSARRHRTTAAVSRADSARRAWRCSRCRISFMPAWWSVAIARMCARRAGCFRLYMLLIALPILPLAHMGDAWLAPSGVPSDLVRVGVTAGAQSTWIRVGSDFSAA